LARLRTRPHRVHREDLKAVDRPGIFLQAKFQTHALGGGNFSDDVTGSAIHENVSDSVVDQDFKRSAVVLEFC